MAHPLLELGVQLGYPLDRVEAVFRHLMNRHGKGDAARLDQDEFLDLLNGEDVPPSDAPPQGVPCELGWSSEVVGSSYRHAEA